eukprot:89391-Chlamydomonas_euryale.AAC.1
MPPLPRAAGNVAGGGRRGSLIAEQYARGERIPKDAAAPLDRHPTNEEVAKAVQQKVAVSVAAEAAIG